MPAHLTFQGRSYANQFIGRVVPHELHFTAEGIDVDYGAITVYLLDDDSGDNLQLARLAPYTNEDGVECGEIGWRIDPDPALTRAWPDLRNYVGLVYGRPIITAGDMPVDRWNSERPSFELRARKESDAQYFPANALPTPEGVTYIPFIDGPRIGYRIVTESGAAPDEYLYFNPTSDTGELHGTPNVFVYMGYENDPTGDLPVHFYDISRNVHGTLDENEERVDERLNPYDAPGVRPDVSSVFDTTPHPTLVNLMLKNGLSANELRAYIGASVDWIEAHPTATQYTTED